MKAVVFKRFGGPEVLEYTEVKKPSPLKNEVLIKIYATSVTAEDPKMRSADHPPLLKVPVGLIYGFRKPKKPILGFEFSGVIEAIGPDVKTYKVNDKVFGYTGIDFGAYAEYKCLSENSLLYHKPDNLSFEQSATIVNGPLSALVYLKKLGKIKKGDKVLIYGASGSVGTAAIQLAQHFGAEISAVCSTKKIELAKSLGASHVYDYTNKNFSLKGEKYDVIFDTVGKTTMKQCLKLLNPKGRYLLTDFGFTHIIAALYTSIFAQKKVIVAASNFYWTKNDLAFLKELAEKEELQPIIDRCYMLEEIVEAHKYVEKGHKTGNVAITVCKNTQSS